MVAFIPSRDLHLPVILNSRERWLLLNHTLQPRKDRGRRVDVQYLLGRSIPSASDVSKAISAAVTTPIQSPDAERVELRHHLNALAQEAFPLSFREVRTLKHSLPPGDPQEAGAAEESLP